MPEQIIFKNVLPNPLRDTPIAGQIWKSEISFKKGNHYLIKAESGKGKTTFLNIIYGLRKDYSGQVYFDNTDISSLNNDAFCTLRTQNLSYLFQDLKLFSNLTALENIKIHPGHHNNNENILTHFTTLEIENLRDRLCSTLSLGQQQRVAVIRSLNHAFEWILLDEPFSHLDERNALKMRDLIIETAQKNNAGILVTSLGSTLGFEEFNLVHL